MIKISTLKVGSKTSRDGGLRLNIEKLHFIKSEINILIGPNGAGKSTLLEVITGNVENYIGEVQIGGRGLRKISIQELSQVISYLPQNLEWNRGLLVKEIILFSLYPFSQKIKLETKDKIRFDEICDDLKLLCLMDKCFGDLSGGEQKRVAIASVLFQDTSLIIMDEPFAALDPVYSKELVKILKKWQAKKSCTMILSIHDLHIGNALGDSFYGMKKGEVVGRVLELDKGFLHKTFGVNFRVYNSASESVYLPHLSKEEKDDS